MMDRMLRPDAVARGSVTNIAFVSTSGFEFLSRDQHPFRSAARPALW